MGNSCFQVSLHHQQTTTDLTVTNSNFSTTLKLSDVTITHPNPSSNTELPKLMVEGYFAANKEDQVP